MRLRDKMQLSTNAAQAPASDSVKLSAEPTELTHLHKILEAGITADPVIRDVDDTTTRALAAKIGALAQSAQGPTEFSLSRQELIDLSMITECVAALDLEDYFPGLIEVGDEPVGRLNDDIWDIRRTAIPIPT